MKLTGPDKYRLSITKLTAYTVSNAAGGNTFKGRAASKVPKLYVVSNNGIPVYVGITKQSMCNRLRMGFQASGESGYHGYAWRRHLKSVDLDIWYDEDDVERKMKDVEAVEAELVYLIRKNLDQWPKYQTEIHFHQSTPAHRKQAKAIFNALKQK